MAVSPMVRVLAAGFAVTLIVTRMEAFWSFTNAVTIPVWACVAVPVTARNGLTAVMIIPSERMLWEDPAIIARVSPGGSEPLRIENESGAPFVMGTACSSHQLASEEVLQD